MRFLTMSLAFVAIAGVPALAQPPPGPFPTDAVGQQVEPGRYWVFFEWDRSDLRSDARATIAEAAASFQRTGEAEIQLVGSADRTGSAEYNLRLSELRARAVEAELIRQGVPAGAITIRAEGENAPIVSNSEGVREPLNRYVAIVFPAREAAPPAAAPAPVAEPAPVEPQPEPDRFTFALGPVYGHNFGESDGDGGKKTENDLIGAELTFRALPGFLGGVSLKQMALWSFNSLNEGLVGRSVASLDFAPDLGIFRPTLAINAGGVYGEGVQDGFVAGPEIRIDIAPFGGFNIGLKAAYDYQFRNAGWDEGIAWGGLDLGLRF